jgi:uncharacterized protein YfiM (DUF2279 family)
VALFVLIVAFQWSSIDNWHGLHVQTEQPDTTLVVNEHAIRECHDAWTSHDKFVHFSVSTALSGFSYYYCASHTDAENTTARLCALSLGACAGFAKEFYDRKNKGCFSWKDLVWNGIGLCVGFLVFMR